MRMMNSSMIINALVYVSAFALIATVCKGDEISESKSLYNFILAVDPDNVLGINLHSGLPHPCFFNLSGVKCNSQATAITEIRLEKLNLSGNLDAVSLCGLPQLQVVSLARNRIRGTIPDSISNCTSLAELDLSGNSLNGSIPIALAELKSLTRLNISGNNFIGVPPYFKVNKYSVVRDKFIENVTELSDASTPVPKCENENSGQLKIHKNWFIWMLVAIGVTAFLIVIIFLTMKYQDGVKDKEISKTDNAYSPARIPPAKVEENIRPAQKLSELVFFVKEEERFELEDLLEATTHLRRQGLCSSLYKVKLKPNTVFAVKRLKNLQASFEEFGDTLRKIGNLKHENILPLVAYYSTNNEKLLIYKYQDNGSLLTLFQDYLEGKVAFPWNLRISIALGLAKSLEIIHHKSDGKKPIPHGNVKPSNILLNKDMEPLLSEYGYAQFLDPNSQRLFTGNGYSAPEKSLTEQADVFSFGVILLELLTGKVVENSGVDLPKWVRSMVREEWTGEVFDKEIAEFARYAFPLLNVSLKCVAKLAEERPTMAEVLEKMEVIINAQEDDSHLSLSSTESD